MNCCKENIICYLDFLALGLILAGIGMFLAIYTEIDLLLTARIYLIGGLVMFLIVWLVHTFHKKKK